MTNYMDEYRRWCEDSYFDDNTRQELKALTSEEEIKDRFSRELEFGTGGLRGIDVYKRQVLCRGADYRASGIQSAG